MLVWWIFLQYPHSVYLVERCDNREAAGDARPFPPRRRHVFRRSELPYARDSCAPQIANESHATQAENERDLMWKTRR